MKKKKIECDVLIIDEASMISLELFNILFNSINDDCIIIIAGDYIQLPSIGVGTVFKDFIDCEKIPCVECKSENISDKVRSLMEKNMKEGTKLYDIQVISPQRYDKNGTDELNYFIGDTFNKDEGRKVYKYAILDSIIQIKNNYKNKVFNGEKGIVTRAETDLLKGMEKLIVNFGEREIESNYCWK